MLTRRAFVASALATSALPLGSLGCVRQHAPLTLRPAEERGAASRSWLEARYSFSFSKYRDPRHMGFRALRVLNEDRISPGGGFPMHGHQDMEIVTWVLGGALEHKDSLGNGGVIQPGLAQRMSAGTGIRHSEFNPSAADGTHLLQIWLHPDREGHDPGYQQHQFSVADRTDRLCTIASGDPASEGILIHQDAAIHTALLSPGKVVQHEVRRDRHVWLQVASGRLEANGVPVKAGDGAWGSTPGWLTLKALEASEVLVFDLA